MSGCRLTGHYTRSGVTCGWAVTRPELRKVEEFSACNAQCVLLAILRSLGTSSEPVDGFDSFGKGNPGVLRRQQQ